MNRFRCFLMHKVTNFLRNSKIFPLHICIKQKKTRKRQDVITTACLYIYQKVQRYNCLKITSLLLILTVKYGGMRRYCLFPLTAVSAALSGHRRS